MAHPRTLLPLLAALLAPACGADDTTAPTVDERPAFLDLPEREVPGRVFLVGIDGASWDVFDDVLEAGVMPRLRELTERGSKGVLTSMEPTASAILWTTIATGKVPRKHGVLGFVTQTEAGKTVPVTSTLRKVDALWNIASKLGVSVGFLAWWVSWPAEAVRGYLVTDYAWPLKKDKGGFATGSSENAKKRGRTYPAELMEELEPFNLTEAKLGPAELAELRISDLPATRGYAIRDIFLKDLSVGKMTRHMVSKAPETALVATYFDGYDAYCHVHWPSYKAYAAARDRGADAVRALPPRIRKIGGAMDAHLTRIDAELGFLMDQLRPEDVILVISDHGFFDSPEVERIERTFGDYLEDQPYWHTERGIVAAMGGPIRAQAELHGADILDITPTVLALLGLPVGADMDGRVLSEWIDSSFLERHPVTTVPSHDDGTRAQGTQAVESPFDEAMLDRLRQLGYLGEDEDDG